MRRNVEYDFDDDVTIYEEGYRDKILGYTRVFERWEGMGEYDCIDIASRCKEGKGRIFNATQNMKFIARWTTGETSEVMTETFTFEFTEALTEAFTSVFTEALTEEMSEALTEAFTSVFTEALTEEITQPVTCEITQPFTQPFTSEFTQPITLEFTPSSPFNALSTDKPPSLSPPIIAAIVISSLAASAIAIFIAFKCCIAKQSVENIHQMDGLISL